jgi:hypothetical protein
VEFTIIKFSSLKARHTLLYMLQQGNADELLLAHSLCELWKKKGNFVPVEGCPTLTIEEEL